MKLTDTIHNITSFDVDYMLKRAFKSGVILGIHKDQIKTFMDKYPEANLEFDSGDLALNGCTREQLMDFLQIFGGNWNKKVEDWYPDKIRYSQRFNLPLEDPTATLGSSIYDIIVSQAPPPPSCQIIEEEVDVPARKETRRRIQCKDMSEVQSPEQPVEEAVEKELATETDEVSS